MPARYHLENRFLGGILGAIGEAGHEGESLLHSLTFIGRVDQYRGI